MSSMFRQKIGFLERIYRFYDGLTGSPSSWKCHAGCSSCCTSLAIVTSLETAYLWESKKEVITRRLNDWAELAPPLLSTSNEQAAASLSETDLGEESHERVFRRCPLLESDHCSCYEARPLMCRIMLSSVDCALTGYAEIPSELLSLNTALLQIVEELDDGGWSGYMVHLLPHFQAPALLSAYSEGKAVLDDSRLRRNQPNPGLLVPPEHQERVARWLAELYRGESGC